MKQKALSAVEVYRKKLNKWYTKKQTFGYQFLLISPQEVLLKGISQGID